MPSDKQDQWRSMLQQLTTATDGLGMPIDKDILETVAVFRLLGFATTMSCAGHLRRITNGPYIMFCSVRAKKYADKRSELDRQDPERKSLASKALQATLRDQQKFLPYLEEFYQNRQVPYIQRLTVRTMGLYTNYLHCQGAEIARVASLPQKRQILVANQAEIRDFTEFLKTKFFAGLRLGL